MFLYTYYFYMSPHVCPTHNLTRSPPFELRALLSERLEQGNHILFTSLSLCRQDQSDVYNVHEFELRHGSVKSQVSFITFVYYFG